MLKVLLSIIVLLVGCSKGPPDRQTYTEMDRIGETLSQKHELKYLYCAIGGLVASDKCRWAMSITSNQNMTLEEGKALASKLIQDYLFESMEKSSVFSKYLQEEKQSNLTTSHFGFRLAFWDENVDRPLEPYLAQIRFAEDHVFFYYADPRTQALTEPITFSLEELRN